MFFESIDGVEVFGGSVLPAHAGEDGVAAVLEGQMDVLGGARVVGQQVGEGVGHVSGFEAGESKSAKSGQIKQL